MNKFFYSLLVISVLLLGACGGRADSPEPVDGKNAPAEVSWEEAIEILNSGEVTGVFQTHSLDVTLELEDGSNVKTVEPQIDAIFTEIENCGASCNDIIIATE